MLNRITLMGRLTRDPELRAMPTSGASVVSFALAVDRDFKNKATGERDCDFIDCVAYRNTAEFISRYFSKGRLAVAEGRLQIRNWTDKDGNKRRSAEVVVDNMYFADSRRDGAAPSDGGSAVSMPTYNTSAPAANEQYADLSDEDGELPF